MLKSLTIKNIVLIDRLEIPFEQGLCVLTGETGAGKSILLDALGLALGKRAEARLVRHGQEQGSVIASFEIENDPRIKEILKEQAIEPEDMLVLKRVVFADGKSKAFVNGEPVNQSFLQSLAQSLIEIHGQHEQRGLLDVATHIQTLDAYAKDSALLKQVRAAFKHWKESCAAYEDLKEKAEKAKEEEEYLRHVLQELEQLNVQEGEEESLADRRSLLMNSEKIIATLNEALEYLTGKHDVQSSLASAERILHRNITESSSDIFEPALQALDRASIEISEALECIEHTAEEVDIDASELNDTEERLFAIRAAARKYNVPADGLSEYAKQVAQSVELIESQDSQLQALEQQMEEALRQYDALAQNISQIRHDYASKMEQHIAKELAPLKMENAALQVKIEPLEQAQWNENGQDRVSFLVRTNPGSPFGSLGKIASGGELSRFMLAMKVILSGVYSVPTMIFDEIDTGIGGATADAVGKRLGKLGQSVQVLCVTHQPQVASYGNHHLRISKKSDGKVTTTSVELLDDIKRKEEVARMLAGELVTDEARAAAHKLMSSA